MKKIIFTVAVCLMAVAQLSAQEPVISQGDNVVGLGIGFGGDLYSGYGYRGSHFSRMPVFSLSYERCIIGNLFNDKSALGIGGLLGYTSAKYKYTGWGWTSTDIMIGVRGALHYAFVDKLDTYAGCMFGYNINRWKWNGEWSSVNTSGSSGLTYSVFAGGRYYFARSLAGFAEIGYGYTIINAGLAVKF